MVNSAHIYTCLCVRWPGFSLRVGDVYFCVSESVSVHACVCVHVGIQMTILLFSVLARSLPFRTFAYFLNVCFVFERSLNLTAYVYVTVCVPAYLCVCVCVRECACV